MKRLAILIIIQCIASCVTAQAVKIIPAFTGYAVPPELGNEEEESVLFNEKFGVHNWGFDPKQSIQYFFEVKQPGVLSIEMEAKSPAAALVAEIAGHQITIRTSVKKQLTMIPIGSFRIDSAGFYSLRLVCQSMKGDPFEIKAFYLKGTATKNISYNAKPHRNAASVHLFYPIPDSSKAVSFYNEVSVPAGYDHLYSYYMACGFGRGYFGMQVNSPTERRIIFSVWDAGNEAVDRNKVANENKVVLLAKGEDVYADGFGNEGTGGHSHWLYNWKPGVDYRFVVTALPDSATKTTTYSGYFFIPELQKWKLIAAFSAPKDGRYLDGLYSFNEDWVGLNGQLQRKAFFGNGWIRKENGDFKELTAANFSIDATGRAGDRTDFGGGASGNRFYLWNGGFTKPTAKLGDGFTRIASNVKPVIDLYKNADSAVQAVKEVQIIKTEIAKGSIDTSGSIGGVYYKILKEGTGRNVLVTDTVVAFYKGSILNGETFDQTTDKPATFPLNRLIKGWQLAVPMCRVGGKIRLIIPSALAYTIRTRSAKIPPNSILVFDIEVVSVK